MTQEMWRRQDRCLGVPYMGTSRKRREGQVSMNGEGRCPRMERAGVKDWRGEGCLKKCSKF